MRGLPLLVPLSKSTPPHTVAIKERGDLLEPSPSKKERGWGYLIVSLSKGERKERRGCNIANKKGCNLQKEKRNQLVGVPYTPTSILIVWSTPRRGAPGTLLCVENGLR